MVYRVLHEGLQQQRRHLRRERPLPYLSLHDETASKPDLLDIQKVLHQRNLLLEPDHLEGSVVHTHAQEISQHERHRPRRGRIGAGERAD